jgi:uncharacterized membrane protein YcjF (UPF0283 family)
MTIVLLLLVGLFVIVRPRLALSSFTFLVSEVIKALIIVLVLGILVALCVMLWKITGHVTPYEEMPWWGWGGAVSMYGFPLVTMLLIVVDLVRLHKRLKAKKEAEIEKAEIREFLEDNPNGRIVRVPHSKDQPTS